MGYDEDLKKEMDRHDAEKKHAEGFIQEPDEEESDFDLDAWLESRKRAAGE